MHTFTSEDLLLYLYNEASAQLAVGIENALENDWSLREKMDLLKEAIGELASVNYQPSDQSVDRILAYGKSCGSVNTAI
jgi:hypothetical protein